MSFRAHRARVRRQIAAGIAAVALLVGGVVVAPLAFAKTEADRAEIQRGVDELEKDPDKRALAREPLSKCRAALDRAARMRAAGDEAHARVADTVAQAWLDAARELVRTAEIEATSQKAQADASAAGKQVERARALVEEAMMQNGRVRAQLEAAEREAKEKESPARTTVVSDAGAPAPKAPPSAAPAPKAAPKKDGKK